MKHAKFSYCIQKTNELNRLRPSDKNANWYIELNKNLPKPSYEVYTFSTDSRKLISSFNCSNDALDFVSATLY